MNKKKIIALILVLVVFLLGGASIYIASQMSTKQAVAPTAPESKPAATDSVVSTVDPWVGSAACTTTGVATEVLSNIPNCSSITGPETMTLGQTATYSATFNKAPSGALADLDGSIFYSNVVAGVDQKDINNLFVNPYNRPVETDGGTLRTTFTPTAVGQYWLRCRAWNDAIAECLPPATVDAPPRFACTGLNYEKLVTVTVAVTLIDGEWSAYGACSATACGTTGTKTRTCNNPAPSNGGAGCTRTDNTLTTPTARTESVACSAAACPVSVLEGSKTAYKNVTANTPGVYALSTEMSSVSKSQIFVYTISLNNTSTATASGVVVKDSVADLPVTFMDAQAGCSYAAANTEVTCNTTVQPGQTKTLSFRVKAVDGIANGTVITNLARVTYQDGSLDLSKDLTVSTVVGCNHTCTTSEECSTNLTCDTTTSKCRVAACLTEDDCTCPTVVPARVVTQQPVVTRVVTTVAPTVAAATPTILPETGIFDLPGVAAFGGGLLLAVIGILLAL